MYESQCLLMFHCNYYYNHFTALWTLSGITWVSWHQKNKTNLDWLEQEMVSGNGYCCKRHMVSPHSP